MKYILKLLILWVTMVITTLFLPIIILFGWDVNLELDRTRKLNNSRKVKY